MEQVNQQPPGGQQSFPQTNSQPEKQLMTILGVQGLSYQNYSVVELKIVLQIIRHAQKVIQDYITQLHKLLMASPQNRELQTTPMSS